MKNTNPEFDFGRAHIGICHGSVTVVIIILLLL